MWAVRLQEGYHTYSTGVTQFRTAQFLKIPLFLFQVTKIHQFYPQFNRLHSPHSGFSRIFLLLIPIIQMASLACRGSAQISHFLLILLTLAHLTFSIWLQLLFFWVGMSILSCGLLLRGDCYEYFMYISSLLF